MCQMHRAKSRVSKSWAPFSDVMLEEISAFAFCQVGGLIDVFTL